MSGFQSVISRLRDQPINHQHISNLVIIFYLYHSASGGISARNWIKSKMEPTNEMIKFIIIGA